MATGSEAVAAPAAAKPAAEASSAKFSITNLTRIGGIVFQLAVILLVIREFQLESRSFRHLMAIGFAGFVVHWLLPQKARLPFFAILSVGAVIFVIEPINAVWVLGLGAALIGIAHLPIAFRPRLGLMLAATVGLGLLRSNVLPAPFSSIIWPILGAMFMFRMIIYMYDLRNKSAPFSLWHAVSYFFMMPNVVLTLFPLVDYQTYTKVYYNTDEAKIYQKGASWILRGTAQLILYRLIYQNLSIGLGDVTDILDVMRHTIATWGLYFKVIGTFSIAMGVLHLFGFNMPLPNNNMLLSENFADIWRRGNIYWKDFMQKMFFNPVNMMLNRRISMGAATAISVAYAFIATWLLHSYQWYWIGNRFPILWQDIVMWGWLGVCVYINMYLDTKKPKKKSLKKPVRTLKGDIIRGLKTVGTMTSLMLMWTIVWVSPGWAETKYLLKAMLNVSVLHVAIILGALLLYGLLVVLYTYTPHENSDYNMLSKAKLDPKKFWRQSGIVVAVGVAFVILARFPDVFAFSPKLTDVVDRLREHKLSAQDETLLKQGYYEEMSDATRFSPELKALYDQRPQNWDVNPFVVQFSEGYPDYGLDASKSGTFKGAPFSVNRWRMRDKDYELEKKPGTYRIAFFGQSVEQGSGVADGQAYESLVEDRLNKERVATSTSGVQRWEILNFANGGYGPLHKLAHLETTGFKFNPDAALYVSITDTEWVVDEIRTAHAHPRGLAMLPYPEVQAILQKAGITQDLPQVVVVKKAKAVADDLVRFVYARMVKQCKERGVRPFYIILQQPELKPEFDALMAHELAMAKEAGFEVLDLRNVYGGLGDPSRFWIAPFDKHPNAEAHAIIAGKMYEQLLPLLPR